MSLSDGSSNKCNSNKASACFRACWVAPRLAGTSCCKKPKLCHAFESPCVALVWPSDRPAWQCEKQFQRSKRRTCCCKDHCLKELRAPCDCCLSTIGSGCLTQAAINLLEGHCHPYVPEPRAFECTERSLCKVLVTSRQIVCCRAAGFADHPLITCCCTAAEQTKLQTHAGQSYSNRIVTWSSISCCSLPAPSCTSRHSSNSSTVSPSVDINSNR